ncbi:MAG: Gfo/Idh/MocA family oxidoreductase [Candidatus Caenarcaniphilales bacterium]|nr:Gfo/Idh/MocA family oxidoreductase [Candidatus Caenarcaniphilales bacterium]
MIGLAGAGRWGENLIRNLIQVGVLHTVCDTSQISLDKIASKFPTVKLTSSFDSLILNNEIQAIVISTPSTTHHELAKKSLEAGKHVYVEKPLAKTEEEAKELIDLANKSNLTLMVGHLLLYHPAVNKLRDLISQGELGDIRFINSDRRNFALTRMDSNVIWDLAPHDMSMISYILDNHSIELVDANGFSTSEDGVIDVAHLDVCFKGGICAHIHNSWIDPQKQCLLTVNGSKKSAVINDTRGERKLELYSVLPDGQLFIEQPVYSNEEPLRREVEHFIDCVKKGGTPLSDGFEGYKIVKVLEGADKKMRKQESSLSTLL